MPLEIVAMSPFMINISNVFGNTAFAKNNKMEEMITRIRIQFVR